MEYCPHGDLSTCLKTSDCLPELEVQQITFQILEGLSFLHDNGFTHRDLKPGVRFHIGERSHHSKWSANTDSPDRTSSSKRSLQPSRLGG